MVFSQILMMVVGGLLWSGSPASSWAAGACRAASPEYAMGASPDYYAFDLVSTRKVPGTGRASGRGEVSFERSPFGVAIGADGSYRYALSISARNLNAPGPGVYVAWVMTPELDQVVRLGTVTHESTATGSVRWNKFIVALTFEPEDDPEAATWTGPIVMRGVSRSGLMHTMAGHGPFEQELCATYGYGN